ncbi:MAG: aminoglycoside phosphotransferase family protein [Polymorphobacter sp.]
MLPPATAPAFLAANGWAGARILPLAGDASFRRYFRIVEGCGASERRAVLMDAPPDKEDSRPFLSIGAHLHSLGFSAPQPLAIDLAQGLILLEDFGDARVNPLLIDAPAREPEIYAAAIDLLAALHRHPAPAIAPYGEAELRREVRLFVEWYLPAAGTAEAPGYDAAWDNVFASILRETRASPVLTLRDYHADNLMLIDRPGLRGLGLLDYQDALAGHPAYDLVSLLQDARRDVAPALEAAMLDRYTAAAGITDRAGFRAAYEILGAQRNTKILGVFTRLWKRDNKPAYPQFNPRVWGYLERNLAHPALGPVAGWFGAHVPASARQPFETAA